MRQLLEQDIEVAVVKDATAGARRPDLVNFGSITNAVMFTEDVVKAMKG